MRVNLTPPSDAVTDTENRVGAEPFLTVMIPSFIVADAPSDTLLTENDGLLYPEK